MRLRLDASMFLLGAALCGSLVYSAERSSNETLPAMPLREFANSSATAALGQTLLHVSVQSGGSNLIHVTPGFTVAYSVIGLLGDDDNQGLALVGFDLDLNAGPLPQADNPTGDPNSGCENPMIHFTIPWGINNPAGFGGTIIGGDLIQVGGGQNTINNGPNNPACAPNCAPFPIGTVLLGVAKPTGCGPSVLVTGSFTAPLAPGTSTLALENLFANIIMPTPNGNPPFWPTQAAGVGTISNLTIVVEQPAGVPAVSEWGILILVLLGLVAGSAMFRNAIPKHASWDT